MRRIRTGGVLLFLGTFLVISFPTFARPTALSPAEKSEIQHLLTYIEQCSCQFYRNGTWYQDTKAARKHVELKYDYFAKKGRVNSSEDFINRCASKSEISGKPYMVKCGDGSPLSVGQWLSDELQRYRRQN